jgi:hypothetical protein
MLQTTVFNALGKPRSIQLSYWGMPMISLGKHHFPGFTKIILAPLLAPSI